ncbi:hypothetical protein J8281_14475 [Aquimarina sp. U1-2]|uniref:hypothetical protein n=1 Tax=Aquimarina sp. U1-2 TaxID=2823141 RepID=UPI001AECC315|nr:hypothetical protein [Aquimarina sp. U1-2]MBP2833397.1 hypothetical protein [Aquimarina sp. U1-2]
MNKTYRTCQNCGTTNLNRDFCKQCGEIINIELKRKQQQENRIQKKKQLAKSEKRNAITLFFENAREHPNFVVRWSAKFFYSIWVVVLAVGSFLAFLLGYIAA